MTRRLTTTAITLALLLFAGACTNDSNDNTASPVPDSPSTTATEEGLSTFEGELVRIVTPAGWTASEHDDGDGVSVQGPEVTVEVTAVSSVLFGALFLELPAPAEPEALAELIVPALGTGDGVDTGEAEIVVLDNEVRAVVVPASGPDGEGEVILFDLGGAIAVATAHTGPGLYTDVRSTVHSAVASFALTASVEELLAAMDSPPDVTGG